MFSLEFWLILAAICILGEIITTGFYLMSVGIGAGAATVANYMGFDPITQLIVFAVVTIILLAVSRPFGNRLTRGSPSKKATSDRLIGNEGVVSKDIDPENDGMIKIKGESWRAISNEKIHIGEKVIVKEVKGVKLFVEKKNN